MAALISLVLLILFYWWFRMDWVLTAGYAVLALIATISVPLFYRVAGFTQADELEWLEHREAQEHAEMVLRLREVRADLDSLGIEEGVRQADMLTGILEDYHSVVETRFVGKKHSPLAYLSAARTVQKHAIQNLSDVVAVGHSISTINRNTFEGGGESQDRQMTLQTEQQARLENHLAENRRMFDALTDTAVEVANIKSFSRYEQIDTLARLVSLAEIANNSGK
ncbi:MAG: hypothetical protein KTR32_33525 [Granulosicoccus sp.]|nr:hypothetical protein [Granulosicoccus sp.]